MTAVVPKLAARPSFSQKQLMVLASDDGPKRGWLTKRGQIWKTWKRRFFVLRAGSLSYFTSPDDFNPIDTLTLYGAAVIIAHPSKMGGRANCLEISTPARTLWAFAEDLGSALEWARALEKEAIKASLMHAPRLPAPIKELAVISAGSVAGYGSFDAEGVNGQQRNGKGTAAPGPNGVPTPLSASNAIDLKHSGAAPDTNALPTPLAAGFAAPRPSTLPPGLFNAPSLPPLPPPSMIAVAPATAPAVLSTATAAAATAAASATPAKPAKTSVCCGYTNCMSESVFGSDGFCAKHYYDVASIDDEATMKVKASGIFGFLDKKRPAPVPHHSLKFTNELKDKWIDSGNEVVFKDLPRLAKRMSVWTQQTGLCVDCGRKVSAPVPGSGALAPTHLHPISIWTAICNVVLAVSIYLEADEKKVESIFHALSSMGKGLKSKDADLAPLCEELFTKHVGLRSKTFSVFRAAHQSALLPAIFYLQKEVIKPESYGILKDVQKDYGWRILFSLGERGATVSHMRWAQSTDLVTSPKHFMFAWDVRMHFPLDLSNLHAAYLRVESIQLHESMAADRKSALTALLLPPPPPAPAGTAAAAVEGKSDAPATAANGAPITPPRASVVASATSSTVSPPMATPSPAPLSAAASPQ